MDIEQFREYCLSKKGVTEELPFGPETLVYKVMGKIFALTGLDSEVFTVNLKCEPEKAISLREEFSFIIPGYHMNKKHWNTVNFERTPTKMATELIDHSYEIVASGLTKKLQAELAQL
ncbi:MmcQ/YjbR family DNA-binding protein [Flectobacillus sp. BAB-3569]|uniref:MmcQ/YjbR family DNA-binding protein n=1 Tax=Flectobacillus sp. BAB-3569 TaxID=1509483 RepID=UPI000BA3C80D|nr:MmcQ/YjbR family DNA-binding protein [Flectobacillus sp. BAB-3569]PAC28342.1 MmcQ-like protein [Flectobacillus sp. BAB-3569]